MNYKKCLVIFKLVFCSLNCYAQQSKAVMEIDYETKIISDSINKAQIRIYSSTLFCNGTESLYCSKEAIRFFKGLYDQKINTDFGSIPKYPKSLESAYKKDNQITAYLPVGKYIFAFEEPPLEWEILNEVKIIQGHRCQLAKTVSDNGDTYFAWFTDDISVQDGPFRFKNLAGLVLEVYNKSRTIEIHATEIRKSEEAIEPLKYTHLIQAKSKKQFLDARKIYHDNPSIYNGNLKIFDGNGNEKTGNMHKRIISINVFLD